jgi:thiosulfate/3-mercaptopyruvate sulfurtransferase
MRKVLVAAILCGSGSLYAAGAIVGSEFVAEAIKRGAIIWDIRSADDYAKGHIPGAVNIGAAGVVLRNANTEDFLPTPEIERILGTAGIDPAKEIVVYSSRGDPFAYFGLYTVQHFGGRQGFVYHDGIDGWRAAGQEVSTEPHRLAPVALRLVPDPNIGVTTEGVVAALGRRDVQIVDARTVAEHAGTDIRAIRGGHIPGAINIPYEQNWVDPDAGAKLARKQVLDNSGMSLKPREDLKKLYSRLDPEKETIVYCQSGVRAAETAAVLTQLGYNNVKVYDSSWLGYAAKLSAPANNETFFNVGALNSRLATMQQRIEQLERELAAAKSMK